MKIKGLTHVRLFAWPADWPACCAFYGDVLGLTPQLTDVAAGLAMFRVGEVRLLVERADEDNEQTRALVARFAGISLRVDSTEQARNRLAELGIPVPVGPQKQPWGDILFHVKDPAGNVITLIEFGSST